MIIIERLFPTGLKLFLIAVIMILGCLAPTQAGSAPQENKPSKIVAVYHCNYPPVSSLDKTTARASGFFIDIMDAIARREGLQVEYICRNDWPEMIRAIEMGEADLGVLLKSAEREKRLLFSVPVDMTYLSFFARSQSSVDADMAPEWYTVGVINGSMSHEQMKHRPGVKLLMVDSYQSGIFSLLAGEMDLFAGEESMILKRVREIHLDDRVKKVGRPFVERKRCLAVRKDNVQLLKMLNGALSGFVEGGEYQKIYLKWFGTPTPYWTVNRIIFAAGIFLLAAVSGMAFWRYQSIARINRELISQIAERKRAEEALKSAVNSAHEEKAKAEAIIAAMGDAVSIQNVNYQILYQNQVSMDIYGDHVGEYCYRAYQDKEQVCKECHLTMTFADGMVHKMEQNRVTASGTRYYDITASPIRDFSGKIIAGIELVRDITERKTVEDSLRQSEQFVRNILDTVDEGFIVIARDYRILTANKAYCSQVGGCDETVIGRKCHEVSHRSARPCYDDGEQCAVRKVFETGQPSSALHRHTDTKGALLYVETKAFPLKDASGAVNSVIETINNITEKHLLEEERLKTQKLEAIGTLAGGIAHDFNNLLQGVFGYISMARMTLADRDRALAMLDQAEQALHLSVNLTTQLLTFSKGGKPRKKIIMPRPVIENAAKFALSGSSADLSLSFDEDLWAVDADEGQLGQVIQNIVLNADQAMPEGGAVDVAARNIKGPVKDHPQLPDGNYVGISIRDSGIGIPEQYLQKIFDPYFTTKEKGSGLGLATSYSIIRNHGGLIDVISRPGGGSTFSIYLPAVAMESRVREIRADSPAARKGKILVMDDEIIILNIAREMIRALGHEVALTENGEAAIEEYLAAIEAGKPFDVVILDLTIRGGMGGREALQRLLAIDPGVRAVVSSGYSGDAVVSDHKKYGFKARLTKPYKIEGLRDTLNILLKA